MRGTCPPPGRSQSSLHSARMFFEVGMSQTALPKTQGGLGALGAHGPGPGPPSRCVRDAVPERSPHVPTISTGVWPIHLLYNYLPICLGGKCKLNVNEKDCRKEGTSSRAGKGRKVQRRLNDRRPPAILGTWGTVPPGGYFCSHFESVYSLVLNFHMVFGANNPGSLPDARTPALCMARGDPPVVRCPLRPMGRTPVGGDAPSTS